MIARCWAFVADNWAYLSRAGRLATVVAVAAFLTMLGAALAIAVMS